VIKDMYDREITRLSTIRGENEPFLITIALQRSTTPRLFSLGMEELTRQGHNVC